MYLSACTPMRRCSPASGTSGTVLPIQLVLSTPSTPLSGFPLRCAVPRTARLRAIAVSPLASQQFRHAGSEDRVGAVRTRLHRRLHVDSNVLRLRREIEVGGADLLPGDFFAGVATDLAH